MLVIISLSQHYKKLLPVMLLFFIALVSNTNVTAQYAGGTGTSGDPYQISTVTQLQAISSNLDSHFILVNDIDASDTKNWNSGAGFVQIGTVNFRFSGSFNGQDFTIDSLYINRNTDRRVGLFGALSGSVTRVRLTELKITGKQSVGGIVGENFGSISKVSVQGTVTATDVEAGGIVGTNAGSVSKSSSNGFVLGSSSNNYGGLVGIMYQNGSIIDSYSLATVSVSGGDNVGGLLGRSSSTNSFITNSYAAGLVSGNTTGGLLEDDTGTLPLTITQSFWDIETTGQSNSAGGVKKTTAEMQNTATFTEAGWDYSNTWYQRSGENNGYPQLQALVVDSGATPVASEVTFSGSLIAADTMRASYTFSDADGDIDVSSIQWFRSDDAGGANKIAIPGARDSLYILTSTDVMKFISVQITPKDVFKTGMEVESSLQGPIESLFQNGTGTEADPYHIETLDDLQNIRFFVNNHFVQIQDIDASPTWGWNNGEGFIPIESPFRGTYNGNNFVIDSLSINRPSSTRQGFFGFISKNAVLKNIGLTDVSVHGRNSVGGLAGTSTGTISNSFATGEIHAENNAGLLVGDAAFGIITHSYAEGTISGTGLNLGGLVGFSNENHNIFYSFASVDISGGDKYIGGLVGESISSTITNSYATGDVEGTNYVGGLVGSFLYGTITNSYATGKVDADNNEVGGWVGQIFDLTITNSFWDTQTSGQSVGVGFGSSTEVTGKTTAEMQQRSTFKDAGWNFSTVWDIDEGESYPFFKAGKDVELTVTGNEGWRMLSTLEGTSTYEDFLFGTWSQGFPGAKSEEGNPSVLLWDEASRSWMAPSNSSDSTARGQGFLAYLFADDDNDGTPEGFPKDLTIKIEPDTGEVNIPVSFTSSDSASQDGWNFAGNPFGESIDWDATQGIAKTNLSNTFYVWSDSAGGGQGAYLVWNGITGTLPNGKIAPWQGFWVKAMEENPQLTISPSAKSEGGVYRKTEELSKITLSLTDQEYKSQASVLFDNNWRTGLDPYDAFALASLNDTTLSIGLADRLGSNQAMSFHAIPERKYETYAFDLEIDSRGVSDELTLSWDIQNIDPNLIYIGLFDRLNDVEIRIEENGSLSFELSSDSLAILDSLMMPQSPVALVGASDTLESRFVLRVDTSDPLSSEIDSELPKTADLSQNYPNPFNPSTTINYGVPQTGQVTLTVYNLLGQKVSTLVNANQTAGRYSINFDASNLSSGMYFYRLQTAGKVLTEKMMLIK